jgi:uncharacterized protein YidB (DUF937 family)
MFDQILQMVKEHLGNNPQVAAAIPPGQENAVHEEVANQVTNGLVSHAATSGGAGGLLSQLQNTLTSGSPVVNAIEGGLVSSLASKFGLPPMVTGAIAASLPGLLKKFAHKAADPNDPSISQDSITQSLSKMGGGLGSMFNRN